MSEILTNEEMMHADRITIGRGIDSYALMQRAGWAVAEEADRMVPSGKVLVVAGRGNNGGDGFVAATELRRRGIQAEVILLCNPGTLKGDAARAASEWPGQVTAYDGQPFGKPALIIDALFGAGLNRPVKGDPYRMIEAINASGIPVLSVDLPSGLNGTTGQVMGATVNAVATITFFRKKPAHLLLPGRIHCGRVSVADIGIADDVPEEIGVQTFENTPALWRTAFPLPRIDGHKYSRGHCVVTSGGIAMSGASRLSARGALRAGAGLVTVAAPPDALAVQAAALNAIMVRTVDTPVEFATMLADARLNACVIGPGNGVTNRTRDVALTAIGAGRACVLDADALTVFADEPQALFDAVAANHEVVLTPHEGEFRRLFSDIEQAADTRSKLERARLAARRSGAVVLLKGPDTMVASPDGRASISANAPPWLATAGSGDVLAGFIGGLLAQGVKAFEAASIGVWLHGEAGTVAGPGLIAEDLPEALPQVLCRLYGEFGVTG